MSLLWRSLVLLYAIALVGCGSPAVVWPEGMPARNAAIADQPITLRVWLAAD